MLWPDEQLCGPPDGREWAVRMLTSMIFSWIDGRGLSLARIW